MECYLPSASDHSLHFRSIIVDTHTGDGLVTVSITTNLQSIDNYRISHQLILHGIGIRSCPSDIDLHHTVSYFCIDILHISSGIVLPSDHSRIRNHHPERNLSIDISVMITVPAIVLQWRIFVPDEDIQLNTFELHLMTCADIRI